MKKHLDLPWFVILLGLIFPLILYANNLGEVAISALWKPLLFSILVVVFLYGGLFIAFREHNKSAIMTGILSLGIFTYGHLYNLLKSVQVYGHLIGRYRYLLPLYGLIFLGLIICVIKNTGDLKNLIRILNTVGVFLFLIQLLRVGIFEIKSQVGSHQIQQETHAAQSIGNVEEPRDIYLIVLDAYARSDWLQDWLEIDNSEFVRELEEMGFYVAECSRSNYSFTNLSMTAMLNLDYVDQLFENVSSEIDSKNRLKQSMVRQMLSDSGYDLVAFHNNFPWLTINDADIYIDSKSVSPIESFDMLFLKTTILTVPYDFFRSKAEDYRWSPDNAETTQYAKNIQFILDYLRMPVIYDNPVFVYAHIISPHYPYIFNEDGSINYDWELDKLESQRSTYKYLNSQMLEIIPEIMANSDPEPIIILQSDHAVGEGGYKNLILNAYYLPDGGESTLYPTITPVNSFRVIIDYYFQTDFGLLEDRSYYSVEPTRYNFELVEDPYLHCRELIED